MRLSWNEIRVRASAFSKEWEGEGYEKGQTQLFYRDFFEVFGVPVRRVASFEEPVKNLGEKRGFIDLFWKGLLLVEQKSVGRDLKKAKTQALHYFPGLKDVDLPRYILLSDFQTFELYDLEEDDHVAFALEDLPAHVEKLGFIIGVQKRTFKDQDPVNIEASELVGRLHDSLKASGYDGHDLEQFLVRIVFCLFADDTGIFEPRDIFLDLLETRTREDGSDLGGWLAQLFQTLNTAEDRRPKNIDEDLARFPYVNGDLFKDPLLIPSFDAEMRARLLEACRFDWSGISPAIFGSLFQSVMNKKERRAQGAHYTTEKNIVKVIQPLFLDGLRAEFERLKGRKDSRRRVELQSFHERLGRLTFFDPACGCGNFLIIAYRELRSLELELVKELIDYERDEAGQFIGRLLVTDLSKINVDQFYGIEIGEFASKIAETALWMMDHIMNNRLSLEFGQTYVRIPLQKSPHIVHADALATDWNDILAPERCTYVLGNPPFVGFVFRSPAQKVQFDQVLRANGVKGSRIDYVLAWFLKASAYARLGGARVAFVSTNSITQGEQVAQVWPAILERYRMAIAFAHRTFAWGSDARGKAHVHVVIIGLDRAEDVPKQRRLFSYADIKSDPVESTHGALSPYLVDASGLSNPSLVVDRASRPLNGLPKVKVGTKPVDGGHYLFSADGRRDFLATEPAAADLLLPFLGAREFLQGEDRWILWVHGVAPQVLRSMPHVMQRISTVRQYRTDAEGSLARQLASSPTDFHVTLKPDSAYLALPEVSSARREYLPIGWLEPPTVPSNQLIVLEHAELWHFAILCSRMHNAWQQEIGGKLKSDFRYAPGLVYNTFPMPPRSSTVELEGFANAILEARAAHVGATLSDLYDPLSMPANLRKAHLNLDRSVDQLYRRQPFSGDRERVEHLLGLYEKVVAPLTVGRRSKRTGGRAKSKV